MNDRNDVLKALKEGGYYKRRDGEIVGPAYSNKIGGLLYIGGCYYTKNRVDWAGEGYTEDLDLIEEVNPTNLYKISKSAKTIFHRYAVATFLYIMSCTVIGMWLYILFSPPPAYTPCKAEYVQLSLGRQVVCVQGYIPEIQK